ncbi:MAG: PD-(D/E)XK nuclease family protein, partial [Anaerolineae bacterium]|nr:PD-(D/E)XK nuclease family protein [Anaerolineae bacterium]
PYRLEAGFGFDNQPVWIELDDEVGKIRVRGKIDRIDCIGKHVVVMDYKSGSTEIKPTELADGRNYQMLVYMEAVRQIVKGYTVAGGFFWHLADVKGKGIIDAQSHDDLLNTGKKRLAGQISALREADFSVEPNKPQPNGLCTRYCEFGKLCRHYRAVSEDEE